MNDTSHHRSVYRFEWASNTASNIKRISLFYIKHLFPKCITLDFCTRWTLNAKSHTVLTKSLVLLDLDVCVNLPDGSQCTSEGCGFLDR